MTCRTTLRAPRITPGSAHHPAPSGPAGGLDAPGVAPPFADTFSATLARHRSRFRCQIETDGSATVITLIAPPVAGA